MDCINIVLLLIRYTTDAIHPAPAGNIYRRRPPRASPAPPTRWPYPSRPPAPRWANWSASSTSSSTASARPAPRGRPRAAAHAVQLIEHAREIRSMLARQTDFGPLQVGATTTLTVGNYLATLIAADFAARRPGRAVGACSAIASSCSTVRPGLDRGHLPAHRSAGGEPWVEDELVVFCAPGHPWRQRWRWPNWPPGLDPAGGRLRHPQTSTRHHAISAVSCG